MEPIAMLKAEVVLVLSPDGEVTGHLRRLPQGETPSPEDASVLMQWALESELALAENRRIHADTPSILRSTAASGPKGNGGFLVSDISGTTIGVIIINNHHLNFVFRSRDATTPTPMKDAVVALATATGERFRIDQPGECGREFFREVEVRMGWASA